MVKTFFQLMLAFVVVLSCKEEAPRSSSSTPGKSSVILNQSLKNGGSPEYTVDSFIKDGSVIVDRGKTEDKLKRIWDSLHVRWGFRRKPIGDAKSKIHWVQRNQNYDVAKDTTKYSIVAPEATKGKFVPKDIPAALKKEKNLEVVVVLSTTNFEKLASTPYSPSLSAESEATKPKSEATKPKSETAKPRSEVVKPKLAAATGISFSNIGATSLQVNWRAAANASNYDIHYSTANNFPAGSSSVVIVGRVSSRVITGLSANTEYHFKLVSKAAGYRNSDASAVASQRTRLATPSITRFTAIGATGATVNWGAVAGAASYTLDYSPYLSVDNDFPSGSPTLTGLRGTSRTITGLSTNTYYHFRIKAVGTGGAITSATSRLKSVWTKLLPPTRIRFSNVEATSLKISWTAAAAGVTGNGATGYDIEYSISSSFAQSTVTSVTVGAVTSKVITNLSPSTKYYFRLISKAAGPPDSAASVLVSTTTKAPNNPPALRGTAYTTIDSNGWFKLGTKAPSNLLYIRELDGDNVIACVINRTVEGWGTAPRRWVKSFPAGKSFYQDKDAMRFLLQEFGRYRWGNSEILATANPGSGQDQKPTLEIELTDEHGMRVNYTYTHNDPRGRISRGARQVSGFDINTYNC